LNLERGCDRHGETEINAQERTHSDLPTSTRLVEDRGFVESIHVEVKLVECGLLQAHGLDAFGLNLVDALDDVFNCGLDLLQHHFSFGGRSWKPRVE
jgi:hypothetical protein